MTHRTALAIALKIARRFDFSAKHTEETREAQAYLRHEINRGSWHPAHVERFKAALEVLDRLK